MKKLELKLFAIILSSIVKSSTAIVSRVRLARHWRKCLYNIRFD